MIRFVVCAALAAAPATGTSSPSDSPGSSKASATPDSASARSGLRSSSPSKLQFSELVTVTAGGRLEVTPKVKALDGKRVTVVGFMAKMEKLPQGSFFLVPRPLEADESGAGSADLPPETIRVIVKSAHGKPIDQINRALEVTGVLELGARVEPDGLPSFIRIVLDPPGARKARSNTAVQGGAP